MANKLASSVDGNSHSDDQEPQSAEQKQRIFDERFDALTNGFGKACEEHNVPVAIAIAIHPKEDHPIVFARGHQYDVASLLASVLRGLKQELISGLSIEPEIDYQGGQD